jgi:ATP-dependent RNA helicase RhlE
MSFSAFNLDPKLQRALTDLGFTVPTPIQEQAIPPMLEGRDLLASAMTGSGKTAAFGLPLLQRLMKEGGRRGVRALVLAPTRELALQVDEHLRALARYTGLKSAAVHGGVGMIPQERAIRGAADIIVATPGRLLDHLRRHAANMAGLEVLIIDEADRMLDMGFLPDVKRILKLLPSKRQTLMFSATLPPPIVELCREMLREPVRIDVQRLVAPPTAITQSAYPVAADLKSALLLEILKRTEVRNMIAFTRTKHRANRLADFLTKNGVRTTRIHGNRSQSQRTDALSGFKGGRFQVLVATDIAARGIDVDDLSHVLNFDVPHVPEDYIHRIGRTGRAAATGDAFVFVSPEESSNLGAIERVLGKRLPRITVEGFDYARRSEKLEIPLQDRLARMRENRRPSRPGAGSRPGGGGSSRPGGGGSRPGFGSRPPSRSAQGGARPISRHARRRAEAAGR